MQPFDFCSGKISILAADRLAAESRTTTRQSELPAPPRSPPAAAAAPDPLPHTHRSLRYLLGLNIPGNRFQHPGTHVQRMSPVLGGNSSLRRAPKPRAVLQPRSSLCGQGKPGPGTGSKASASHPLGNSSRVTSAEKGGEYGSKASTDNSKQRCRCQLNSIFCQEMLKTRTREEKLTLL